MMGAFTLEETLNTRRLWTYVVALLLAGVPSFILGTPAELLGFHIQMNPIAASLIFGAGIVAGAFLLSWAAEVAQMDVSGALAIAVLALIAILPEYAVEAVLAWNAGASFDPATGAITEAMGLAAANVTGANRLLIGLGWAAVILIYWLKRRRALDARGEMGIEIPLLTVATLAVLLIFFMNQVHIILAVALIALYVGYLWISSRKEVEEPHLIGAAAMIGALPTAKRRAMVIFLFVFAAAVILAAAEPFVHGLQETGSELGINQFLLIQVVAPLASESPEIIIAVLFCLRANPVAGLTTLISAEVNQLTLLIGSMVVVFSLAAGEVLSFPLDNRQSVEFLLTAAVSLAGLFLIARRVVNWSAGVILLGLYILTIIFSDPQQRLYFTFIYIGVTLALVATDWRRVRFLWREEAQELEDAGDA